MLSRQIMIGRKKNFAIDASMKPLNRSAERFLLLKVSSVENFVSMRIIKKNDRFAEIL